MVLGSMDFTLQISVSFTQVLGLELSLPGSGLNFCEQRLKYGSHIFFSTSKFKMPEN